MLWTKLLTDLQSRSAMGGDCHFDHSSETRMTLRMIVEIVILIKEMLIRLELFEFAIERLQPDSK